MYKRQLIYLEDEADDEGGHDGGGLELEAATGKYCRLGINWGAVLLIIVMGNIDV